MTYLFYLKKGVIIYTLQNSVDSDSLVVALNA